MFVGGDLLFRNFWLRLPNLERSAQVEHSEVVHQAIVVAVLTGHEVCIPSHLEILLDGVIILRIVDQGHCSHGVCASFAKRVLFLRIGTVPVETGMLVVVLFEEVNDAAGHFFLASRISTEEVIVHTEVHCAAHCVVHVLFSIAVIAYAVRSTVEVVVIREQAGLCVGGFVQVIARCLCSLAPLILIGGGPASEKINVSRQVVRRVGEVVFVALRLECDDVMLRFEKAMLAVVPHFLQDVLSIVHVLAVVPAVCCKEKRHHEIHFAVRCAVIVTTRAAFVALPSEVAIPATALVPHVVLGPVPELVKFFLVTSLHGNHHTVRHTFRTDVSVVHIENVSFGTLVVIDLGIVVTLKIVIPQLIHFFLDFFIGLAQDCLERAFVITGVVSAGIVFFFIAVRAVVSAISVKEIACDISCSCHGGTEQQGKRECTKFC